MRVNITKLLKSKNGGVSTGSHPRQVDRSHSADSTSFLFLKYEKEEVLKERIKWQKTIGF